MTASMLFEGLDPYLTWQQFFITIKAELTNPKSSSEVRFAFWTSTLRHLAEP